MTQAPATPSIPDLVEFLRTRRVMARDLIPNRYQQGEGKLCLVLGDNATGKSMVRRLVSMRCKDLGVEAIPLSMEGRAGSGGMGGLKGMVYGDEDWKSTGHNSAGTAASMMKTSRSRTRPHMVYLDEPDTGLGDRWARSLGRSLADFLREPPEHLAALFLTTHRTCLVRELVDLQPHVLLVGCGWPRTLKQWLAGDPRDPEPLEKLGERGIELFRKINDAVSKASKDDR